VVETFSTGTLSVPPGHTFCIYCDILQNPDSATLVQLKMDAPEGFDLPRFSRFETKFPNGRKVQTFCGANEPPITMTMQLGLSFQETWMAECLPGRHRLQRERIRMQ
jgi:hypothetical protein